MFIKKNCFLIKTLKILIEHVLIKKNNNPNMDINSFSPITSGNGLIIF